MLDMSWLLLEKYTNLPSGDQPLTSSIASSYVRRSTSPVRSVSTYTSPFPVRVDVNASCLPSGEYSGRDSVAPCDTRSRASPPVRGTSQMSPPLTNAIVDPSGEMPGSASDGRAVPSCDACASAALNGCATRVTPNTTATNHIFFIVSALRVVFIHGATASAPRP